MDSTPTLDPRIPLSTSQNCSFADLLDAYCSEHHIQQAANTPSKPRFTIQTLQQRIERPGGLGRTQDLATNNDDEERYALGEFVVPDEEDEEENQAEEGFEEALKEGFYAVKMKDILFDTEEKTAKKQQQPEIPKKQEKSVSFKPTAALEETKQRYRSVFSKAVSQLLGKISMLYQSQRPPVPSFPHGSHMLLDNLAFHIMSDSVIST